MSDALHHDHADAPHEGPIKTPKQVIAAVVAGFLIPITIIVLLVVYVSSGQRTGAGNDDGVGAAEALARRLEPVGRVEIGDAATIAAAAQAAPASSTAAPAPSPAAAPATAAAAAAAPAAQAAGAAPALYAQSCQACHASGVAGAPKLGDKAAWAPRAAQGVDAMVASAIKGKGAMPPRGGSTAADADIRATVVYMLGTVK